jgi:hypothetical protein
MLASADFARDIFTHNIFACYFACYILLGDFGLNFNIL